MTYTDSSSGPQPTGWRKLLQPAPPTFGLLEWLLLLLFTAVVCVVVAHHEVWGDEAQGWLIAHNCTLREILVRRLHYEGAPPLWQFVLVPLDRMHLPYQSMNWVSAVLGVIGAFLLLRFAPLPPLLRWLLPFTFFLQYQYSVIGRPYSFFPPLVFGMAMLFPLRKPRPVLFALLAGVAANINLHCLVYALGLAIVYLVHLWGRRTELPRALRSHVATGVAVFALLSSFGFFEALPAPDQTAAHFGPAAKAVISRIVPPEPVPPGIVLQQNPPEVAAVTRGNRWFYRGRVGHYIFEAVRSLHSVVNFTILAVSLPLYSVSGSNLLAILFLVLFGAWLWTRSAQLHLLPLLLMAILYGAVWGWDHHAGLFFVGVIVATWIVLATTKTWRGRPWMQPVFLGCFVLVAAGQVRWSAHADMLDVRAPYDAAPYTIRYLEAHYPGKKIALFGFDSTPLLLEAPSSKFFFNWPVPYWPWSPALIPERREVYTEAEHPDLLVMGHYYVGNAYYSNQLAEFTAIGSTPDIDAQHYWPQRGWHITHTFCGDHPGHAGVMVRVCYDLYEPPGVPPQQ